MPADGKNVGLSERLMKEGVVEELRRGRSLSMFHSSDSPTLNRRRSPADEHGLGYAIRDFLGRKVRKRRLARPLTACYRLVRSGRTSSGQSP